MHPFQASEAFNRAGFMCVEPTTPCSPPGPVAPCVQSPDATLRTKLEAAEALADQRRVLAGSDRVVYRTDRCASTVPLRAVAYGLVAATGHPTWRVSC